MAANDDIRNIVKRIQRGIRKSLSSKELLKIGKVAVQLIQRRTRRGYGVRRSGDRRRKLKPLSRNYIKRRRRSTLSRFTSASKSNLTFSGQMLSSMKARVRRQGSINISFDGTRRDGRRNKAIAAYVSEERPFNNLSGREIEALVEEYDRSMQSQLDKALRGT